LGKECLLRTSCAIGLAIRNQLKKKTPNQKDLKRPFKYSTREKEGVRQKAQDRNGNHEFKRAWFHGQIQKGGETSSKTAGFRLVVTTKKEGRSKLTAAIHIQQKIRKKHPGVSRAGLVNANLGDAECPYPPAAQRRTRSASLIPRSETLRIGWSQEYIVRQGNYWQRSGISGSETDLHRSA